MPLVWAAYLFLLMLQGDAWGCSDLVCYSDYYQTVTCILETWNLHPSTLTLTCQTISSFQRDRDLLRTL